MKKRRKKKKRSGSFPKVLLALVIVIGFWHGVQSWYNAGDWGMENTNSGVSVPNEYPEELVELLERNPETEEFVLNYPLKKDLNPVINLEELKDCNEVPLLLQWDERWGYYEYGADMMGLSGCGPTCLSMVCIYLLQNTDYDPKYVADFSEENGYCVPGSGSAWALISEGGEKLGLDVEELALTEDVIIRNLETGNPIICVMGPGDFTTSGHFIVLVDYLDGKIKVNDPNSRVRSEKLWKYEDIKGQIRNLWVCQSNK